MSTVNLPESELFFKHRANVLLHLSLFALQHVVDSPVDPRVDNLIEFVRSFSISLFFIYQNGRRRAH